MKSILSAQALEGYRLKLFFSDGVEGVVDLSDLVGKGVFSIWNEPGNFSSFRLTDFGAVAWCDEVDLCPDALYLRLTGKSPEELFPALRGTLTHA